MLVYQRVTNVKVHWIDFFGKIDISKKTPYIWWEKSYGFRLRYVKMFPEKPCHWYVIYVNNNVLLVKVEGRFGIPSIIMYLLFKG